MTDHLCDACRFATTDMFGQFWCRKATTINPRRRPIRDGQEPSEVCLRYQPHETTARDEAVAQWADAPTLRLAT